MEGEWIINNENIISNSQTSKLRLRFNAKNLYLVAGTYNQSSTVLVKIYQDAKLLENGQFLGKSVNQDGSWLVTGDTLFTLVESDKFYENLELELTVPTGVRFNGFTFGG